MFDYNKFQDAVLETTRGTSLEQIYNAQNHSVLFNQWYQELLGVVTSERVSMGLHFEPEEIPDIFVSRLLSFPDKVVYYQYGELTLTGVMETENNSFTYARYCLKSKEDLLWQATEDLSGQITFSIVSRVGLDDMKKIHKKYDHVWRKIATKSDPVFQVFMICAALSPEAKFSFNH